MRAIIAILGFVLLSSTVQATESFPRVDVCVGHIYASLEGRVKVCAAIASKLENTDVADPVAYMQKISTLFTVYDHLISACKLLKEDLKQDEFIPFECEILPENAHRWRSTKPAN